MISKFWDELFAYGDQVKATDKTKYAAYKEISGILQRVYDKGILLKKKVEKDPDDELERLVLSIPDVKVYHDELDDSYWYELDEMHFDSTSEVIEHLINYRTCEQARAMNAEKLLMLQAMNNAIERAIKKCSTIKVLTDSAPSRVIEIGEAEA